jgi:hypothetical protein
MITISKRANQPAALSLRQTRIGRVADYPARPVYPEPPGFLLQIAGSG